MKCNYCKKEWPYDPEKDGNFYWYHKCPTLQLWITNGFKLIAWAIALAASLKELFHKG